MMSRGTLAGAAGAYLTGVAVTSGPWLLTTLVLISLRLGARGPGAVGLEAERIVTWIYATAVVLSAPVHIVVSRYTADRLYEGDVDGIGAPLRRCLSATLFVSSALGAALLAILRVPAASFAPGVLLATIIGVQWLLMAVGSGLSTPGVVLRAFAYGAPLGFAASLELQRWAGAAGYLWGYSAGQFVTLLVLLRGVMSHLPESEDARPRLGPAFREYAVLAASALAYHAAIWVDKVVAGLLLGAESARELATLAALAWFAVIPSFAWLYVEVETTFYRRFRAYFDAVEVGATLKVLRHHWAELREEILRIVRGAALVQVGTTAVALGAGPSAIAAVGLPPDSFTAFAVILFGVGAQVLTFSALLVLYYFDLRREAVYVAGSLFGTICVFAVTAAWSGHSSALGYGAGAIVGFAVALFFVQRAVRDLLVQTFQTQPLEVPQ